jgi:hypothetical protein
MKRSAVDEDDILIAVPERAGNISIAARAPMKRRRREACSRRRDEPVCRSV